MRNKKIIFLTFIPILIFAMALSYYVGQERLAYKIREEAHEPIGDINYENLPSVEHKESGDIAPNAYAHRNNNGFYKEALDNKDAVKCENIGDESLKIRCQNATNDIVSYEEAVKLGSVELCNKVSSDSRKSACINIVNAKNKG